MFKVKPDGKRLWCNKVTGEVITCRWKWFAYKYFKADGKLYGYDVGYKDVLNYNQMRELEAKLRRQTEI